MNKLLHRVVFNRTRAQMVVVSEADAASHGGQPAKGAPRPSFGRRTPGLRTCLNVLAAAAIGALGGQPAVGQVIADPTAPASQRPTVLSDQAGRPLVNIQTPTASG